MVDKPDGDPAAFVDQSAAVLGITLDPAVRDGVVTNFKLFIGLVTAIEGFEEPSTPEPPAVFRP